MATRDEKRRQAGVLARRVFDVLVEEPDGLTMKVLMDKCRHNDASHHPEAGFEELMRSCVAPIKAGWLISRSSYLAVSDKGRQAYESHVDPVDFITEAGRRSAKGWLSVEFPKSYFLMSRVKDSLVAEGKAVRRIGPHKILKRAFMKQEPWEKFLPLQIPRRIPLLGLNIGNVDELIRSIGSLPFSEGGHAVYLPPETWKSGPFAAAADFYPANAGLKISKHKGTVDTSEYVTGTTKGDSRIHLRWVHSHLHLTLVANLLNVQGIGPRLYDLVELQCGDSVWTAYVTEHVNGRVPSQEECEAGLNKIRDLQQQGLLKVILPEGFNDEELQCPTCANNAFVDQNGRFLYIDVQNFRLVDYGEFLTEQALAATEASHFGDTSAARGGRYLYQSVPGVRLPGKRSIDERVRVLNSLLAESGASARDRLVLDIGCNIGMMMAQYLKMGASWCHGWDRAHVTPWTEGMLSALGCTRYSTTGGDIVSSQPLRENLPLHLRSQLDGCTVSYLAIRGHIGWLDALAEIPWSILIYEGHEGESREDFDYHLKQLRNRIDFKLGPVTTYSDGDSEPRTLALLLRA